MSCARSSTLRDETVYLRDILDRCQRITAFIAQLDESEWMDDIKTQDSVLRNLESSARP